MRNILLMASIYEVLAHNALKLRNAADCSQARVAQGAGVTQKTISNIEHPEMQNATTVETLDGLARAFRVPVWLLLLPEGVDILSLSEERRLFLSLLTDESTFRLLLAYHQGDAEDQRLIRELAGRLAAVRKGQVTVKSTENKLSVLHSISSHDNLLPIKILPREEDRRINEGLSQDCGEEDPVTHG